MVTHMSGFPREAPCLSQREQMLCPDNNTVMLERIKNLTLIAQPGDKVSYRSDICNIYKRFHLYNWVTDFETHKHCSHIFQLIMVSRLLTTVLHLS